MNKVKIELNQSELSLLSIAILDLIKDRLNWIEEMYDHTNYKVDEIKNMGITQCQCLIDLFWLQAKIDNLLNKSPDEKE